MAGARCRGGRAAGHHPDRNSDERRRPPGPSALAVAGRPVVHHAHLRRSVGEPAEPPAGAGEADPGDFAAGNQSADRPRFFAGRPNLLVHAHQQRSALRPDGVEDAAGLGRLQVSDVGAGCSRGVELRRRDQGVPGTDRSQQARRLWTVAGQRRAGTVRQ